MMKKIFIITLLAITSSYPVDAQVMWNLKGGLMQRSSYYEPYYLSSYGLYVIEEAGKHIDWTAGLEMEIPLSKRFNLETGLRYKNHCSLNKYEDIDFTENTTFEKLEFSKNHIELPLRFTYKQPLGKYFSLHAGIGPYASYTFFDDSSNSFSHNLQIGLEPSVAINWACLSLGATYNVPCFYKGFKDENKPIVMATLGIRFKSHVWKYVGATLLAIASVGAAAAAVWPSNDGYSSYSSGSYSPSYSSSSSSSYSGSSSSSVGKSCKFCAGSGRCSGTNRCRGDGQCKYCYGQGYQSTNGHYHECGVCKGSKKCTFCGGSGKCKHCGGTGKN